MTVEVLRSDMAQLKQDVTETSGKVAEIEATLRLILKRFDVLDQVIDTQVRHDEKIKSGEKERADMWAEIGKARVEISGVKAEVEATKATNKMLSKVVMAGPKWLIAGLGLIVTVVGVVWGMN